MLCTEQQRRLRASRRAKWRRNVIQKRVAEKSFSERQSRLQRALAVLRRRRLCNAHLRANDDSSEDLNMNVETATTAVISNDVHASSSDECDILVEQNVAYDLDEQLRMWVNRHRISHTAVYQLLKILIPHHPELPRHQRTLLRTVTDIGLENVAGGDYSYISLSRVLPTALYKAGLTLQHLAVCNNKVNIQFNVDGVPVFNSVNYSIWPILGCVVSSIKSDVFAVAIYGGTSKPDNFNAYLQPLVSELQQIAVNGGLFIEFLGVKVEVTVENFCCDAPAKADVRLVKQFNARQGCERCSVSGTYMQHRMVLETGDQQVRLRHDDDFNNPLPVDEEDRAQDEYRKEQSVLHSDLRLRMITQFPYDYMHLVCLNVVRNLVNDWNRAKSPAYIPAAFPKMSSQLTASADFIPSEFQRKCRSISDARRWKATEARQFLLYSGIVVLGYPGVSRDLYEHFLLLSSAIRCLCTPNLVATAGFVQLARQLLEIFEANYGRLYGREQVTYRVHSLVHLVDDVERYGVLDNFSCFKFENYLGSVKELVHKRRPTHIVQQICRRLSERDYVMYDTTVMNCECPDAGIPAGQHEHGPTLPHMGRVKQYEIVRWRQYLLGSTEGNRCFLANSEIHYVRNVVVTKNGKVWLLCNKFLQMDDFYTLPLRTDNIPKRNILHSGRIGIWKVANKNNELFALRLKSDVDLCKCVLLPTYDADDIFVAITMLHER